jgi:hypothetical protein
MMVLYGSVTQDWCPLAGSNVISGGDGGREIKTLYTNSSCHYAFSIVSCLIV